MAEIGFLYTEIRHAVRHLRRWMQPRRVPTPLAIQPAVSWIQPEPYGQVLIIGPWNYPVQLLLAPLVGAIAAGNCAVLKPSELAPRTSEVVAGLIARTFPPEFVTVVTGGVEVAQELLSRRWDYIFFTGSTAVGRMVARAAAERLTPYTLELGGKSPCIVTADADLDLAARRIVWGKFFNAGQTCVAPDYLLVERPVMQSLLERLKGCIQRFFGPDPAASPDYARIVNQRHFDRLAGYLRNGQVAAGGQTDRDRLYIAPTLLVDVDWNAPVMQEEIFGPILPVLPFDDLEEVIGRLRQRPRPLALYLFTRSATVRDRVFGSLSFGGGCVNDTLVHLSNPHLPFGGVGESGTGAYHGRFSFETFSHRKAVLQSLPLGDPMVRYQPYGRKLWLIRKVMR